MTDTRSTLMLLRCLCVRLRETHLYAFFTTEKSVLFKRESGGEVGAASS